MPRYGKDAEKLGAALSKKGIRRGSHIIGFLLERLKKDEFVLITEEELTENKIIKSRNFKNFAEFKLFMLLNNYLVFDADSGYLFKPGPMLKKYVKCLVKFNDEEQQKEPVVVNEDNTLFIQTLTKTLELDLNNLIQKRLDENRNFLFDFLSRELSNQQTLIFGLKKQIADIYVEFGMEIKSNNTYPIETTNIQ